MREFHVLNLGAGVQSTTLYLLDERCGHGGTLRFDVAIFADTQAEPRAVYDHLEWLKTVGGPPIWVRTRGNLKDDLLAHRNATGQRVDVTIPVYLGLDGAKEALSSRQCTHQYKVDVVERAIRREVVVIKPRYRQTKAGAVEYYLMPKDVHVHQYFGISCDEVRRMARIRERFADIRWAVPHFPLIDMGWSRRGCFEWLTSRVPYPVPKSACTFCPFRDDHGWFAMKRDDPDAFSEAIEVDRALRGSGMEMERGQKRYLHRSCIPLELVDFDNLPPQTLEPFTLYDCVGMCGV